MRSHQEGTYRGGGEVGEVVLKAIAKVWAISDAVFGRECVLVRELVDVQCAAIAKVLQQGAAAWRAEVRVAGGPESRSGSWCGPAAIAAAAAAAEAESAAEALTLELQQPAVTVNTLCTSIHDADLFSDVGVPYTSTPCSCARHAR